MKHARTLPLDAAETDRQIEMAHIRAHLSAVTTPDSSPTARAAEVMLSVQVHDGQWLITGELPGEPVADYLTDGFDPYEGISDELRAVGEVNR